MVVAFVTNHEFSGSGSVFGTHETETKEGCIVSPRIRVACASIIHKQAIWTYCVYHSPSGYEHCQHGASEVGECHVVRRPLFDTRDPAVTDVAASEFCRPSTETYRRSIIGTRSGKEGEQGPKGR